MHLILISENLQADLFNAIEDSIGPILVWFESRISIDFAVSFAGQSALFKDTIKNQQCLAVCINDAPWASFLFHKRMKSLIG